MKNIFEKIIDREIPAQIVYEDDLSIAFRDIHPIAPVHVLIIPKRKIINLHDVTETEDFVLLGHLMRIVKIVAEQENLMPNGYRIITNVNEYGGQSVYHLHFHLLGGKKLSWGSL